MLKHAFEAVWRQVPRRQVAFGPVNGTAVNHVHDDGQPLQDVPFASDHLDFAQAETLRSNLHGLAAVTYLAPFGGRTAARNEELRLAIEKRVMDGMRAMLDPGKGLLRPLYRGQKISAATIIEFQGAVPPEARQEVPAQAPSSGVTQGISSSEMSTAVRSSTMGPPPRTAGMASAASWTNCGYTIARLAGRGDHRGGSGRNPIRRWLTPAQWDHASFGIRN